MRRALLALAALLSVAAPAAHAQSSNCNSVDLPESNEVYERRDGMVFITGPFLVRCDDGTELRAQTGTLNEVARELTLVGNVDYRDPTRRLTSQNATYSTAIGRLYATGNVLFVDQAEGMTIRGPELEYYKAMEGRPLAQVNAGQRPHLTLQPRGEGKDDQPLEIDGDRLTLLGRNDLSVFGNVLIQRPDLKATAGEARYDGNIEQLVLRQKAVIQSKEYNLTGEVIEARMPGGELAHVLSRTGAVLTGKDLTVTAPELQLFFEESVLQRTVARRERDQPRPVALSKTFRLEADSLDAATPGQQLKQVVAIGAARGESVDSARADSASAPPVTRAAPTSAAGLVANDWITGDTITGYFAARPDTAAGPAPADTTGRDTTVVLERIVSRGAAQSLYRVEQKDAGGRVRPEKGVNFLSGLVIELHFDGGEMEEARVEGLRKGLYLDPATGTARPGGGAAPPRPPAAGRPGGSER